jgi:hypothetical protein
VSSSRQTTGKARGKKAAPISAHPAFPAMVAIWFAALFGLGSLVLPPALPEHLISLTGLDALIPAMAPPLGLKARILIALAATLVGGAGGLALARRIAAAQSRSPTGDVSAELRLNEADRHPDAPARHPISALEELGDERLPEVIGDTDEIFRAAGQDSVETPLRRRPLVASAQTRQPEIAEPCIGEAGAPRYDSEPDIAGSDQPEPLILAEEYVREPADRTEGQPDSPLEELHIPASADAAGLEEASRITAEASDPPPANQADRTTDDIHSFNEPFPDWPAPDWSAASPAIREAPLAELGVTELVERLAFAMHNRRQRSLGVDADAFPPAGAAREPLAEMDPEQDETDGGGGGAVPAMPAALRSLRFDDDDGNHDVETDLALSDLGLHGRPPTEQWRSGSIAAMSAYEPEDLADEDGADEDGANKRRIEGEAEGEADEEAYGSLLDLNMSINRLTALQDFEDEAESDHPKNAGRPFDPPADQHGEAAEDHAQAEQIISDNTDQALREALARLQRINGRG